jgi:hypothetical protein
MGGGEHFFPAQFMPRDVYQCSDILLNTLYALARSKKVAILSEHLKFAGGEK